MITEEAAMTCLRTNKMAILMTEMEEVLMHQLKRMAKELLQMNS